MKTHSLTAFATFHGRIQFFACEARGASNLTCSRRKRSFLSFCFPTASLFAFLLAISPERLEAEIILKSRLSQVTAAAAAGSVVAQVDEPLPQKVTDFSPAALNISATASKDGGSGNGTAATGAQITFDASTDTLVVTASGSASGAAQRSTALPTSHSNNHGGGGGPSILLTFTLTDRSYDFTATGACSAAFSGGSGGSSSGAQLVNAETQNVNVFLVRAEAFSVESADDKSISQSGTLTPGTWLLVVSHGASASANDTTGPASASASASVQLRFTLRPAGAPPPPPPPNHWTNTAGGSFQSAANWSLQTIPAGNSAAIFDPAAAYTVNVGTVTSNRLIIQNGDVTFTNAAYTVSSIEFDPASVVLDNAKLTLASGQLNSGHALIGQSGASRVDVGSNATWISTGSLRVGGPGNGILAIADSGMVKSAESRIGTGVGGGDVFIGGSNAKWTTGNLVVGFDSPGTLSIDAGSVVESDDSFVGRNQPGSSGTVMIKDEAGWHSDGALVVSGSGSVSVLSGAALTADILTIGEQNGVSGSVMLSGVGASAAALPSSLFVFNITTINGTLLIEKGGFSQHLNLTQTPQPVLIGAQSDGTLTIRGIDPGSGKQSQMRDVSALTVGGAKHGTLLIEDQAFVQHMQSATLGLDAGSVGDVTVQNGSWNVDTKLVVASSGRGNLILKDGAAMSADIVTIGDKSNSRGNVVLTGGTTFLDVGTGLFVGEDGSGKLSVAAGATVFVGALSAGNLVMGGQETFTSEVTVGGLDPGSGAGARISVNGNLVMGSQAVSVDDLNITEDGTLACVDATVGAIETSFVRVRLGTVGGTGVVAQFNVSGNLTVGDIGHGLLLLRNGANVTVGGLLYVGPHGVIFGNGTLSAATRIVNGGSIEPGLSPGFLTFDGDFEQSQTGVLEMQIAGTTPGSAHDQLIINGAASLGGTLRLKFIGGFGPKQGDQFELLNISGATTGDFANVEMEGLEPGFQFTAAANGSGQIVLTALSDGIPLPVKGIFRGVLQGNLPGHDTSGFFTIQLTARSGFSARFVLGGRSFVTSGKFDPIGKFSKTIPRKGSTPLTISLELDSVDGVPVIKGTILAGEQSVSILAGIANAFSPKKNPAPQAGKYTMLLQFDPAASATPQANGFGTVVISEAGAIRFTGMLADGTRLSQGTALSRSGAWPLYVLRYKKQGSLFGELQFRDQPGSDFDGTLQLSRPPTPADKIQTAGFLAALSAIGSRYTATPVRPSILDLPNGATAAVSDAELTPALTKSLMLSSPNKFAVLDPGADKFSLSANASNGRLSARFIHPATGLSTEMQGVVFQKQNFGSGFFHRPGTIGSFELQARP